MVQATKPAIGDVERCRDATAWLGFDAEFVRLQ
jgi:hypothetical protein